MIMVRNFTFSQNGFKSRLLQMHLQGGKCLIHILLKARLPLKNWVICRSFTQWLKLLSRRIGLFPSQVNVPTYTEMEQTGKLICSEDIL